MIEIDGSFGEGGGQILRTALSLSCLFQKPFRIFDIRKGRKKPGLMPQHLVSVRASQLISSAEVKGDEKGSMELSFSPKKVKGGDFFFDMGTAGSTMLVLQTLLPAIIFSGEKATITLKGGTHVPFSPSYHYVSEVFTPLLERIGVRISLSIESYGFYPKGGGRIRADLYPPDEVKPLRVEKRGGLHSLTGYSGVGNLPTTIAERQSNALNGKILSSMENPGCDIIHSDISKLSLRGAERRGNPTMRLLRFARNDAKIYVVEYNIELLNVPTPGQGTFVFLKAESGNSIAGFSSLGERGKRAEAVGEEAASEFIRHFDTGAALDPHLSDQIVLYLSMCKEESIFTTSQITQHLLTNLWVISLFHEFRYSIEVEVGMPGKVMINSSSC